VGYGNIGKCAIEAIEASSDLKLAGVVRRSASKDALCPELRDIPVVTNIDQLGDVDVALLTVPTRSVMENASKLLAKGINTVDSFDLHGDQLVELRSNLGEVAKAHQSVAVISAGWDPGSDSILRALFEIMAPRGLSYTNFGPGMSMGHSVVAKALPGVADALSMTMPLGSGVHRRLVYVKLDEGTSLDAVEKLIKQDPYFKNDETHVYEVECVDSLRDVGHGVVIERKGVSGQTANQLLKFEMRINGPAVTAQMMVSSARASVKQKPGAYTLLEMPLLDYFPGNSEDVIRRLV
ncbi:MAG TPA: diaminopimelate dehydrogenase, partial [Natronincola sp.]|nr:diaminopimelate dehydrogenase [Natronincola sp.]